MANIKHTSVMSLDDAKSSVTSETSDLMAACFSKIYFDADDETGSLLNWIQSYLYDRKQHVLLSNWKLRTVRVTSGVLSINHISNIFKYSKCLLYADDQKTYRTINNVFDALLFQIVVKSIAHIEILNNVKEVCH